MTLTSRQKESLDTSSHMVVTAGAGSGKTKVLVERYMSILRDDEELLPRNILALTFTEKASMEMKERIRREVTDHADREGGRWEDILDDLDSADISTIHSFCTSVIRAHPMPLGLDPDITVLTESETSTILKDILNSTFTRPGPESAALRRLIVDLGQFSVVNMVKGILKSRTRLPFDPGSDDLARSSKLFHMRTAKELFERAEIDLKDLLVHLQQLSRLAPPEDLRDSGVRALRGLSEVLDLAREDADSREIMGALSRSREVTLTKGGKERSASRLGNSTVWGGDIKVLKESMSCVFSYVHTYQDILVFVEKEGLMDRARDRITDLIEVVSTVVERCSREKRKRNGMDFDDQISFAMELLENDMEGVLAGARNRFKHVLIDEFQDTDPRQWRLAELLWNDGKGCTLFVVGDPKQSIYGFRSADVRLFMKATGLLDDHEKGNVVVLDRNFRSASEVMDFVNGIFPRILGEGDSSWSVPFDPLDPHRSSGGSVTVVGVMGKQGAEAREGKMAAEMISRAVRGWDIHDGDSTRPVSFSDIAILLPTRKGFERYEDALRDARIPYQVYKGKGYFERQEVKDVFNMLSFLMDPNDDIALAGVLKGPFFSLSDQEMMTLSTGSGSLWDRLKMSVTFEDHALILSDFIAKVHSKRPWMLLEEIFERTAIHATVGGRRQYRNLDRLLEWITSTCMDRDVGYARDTLKMMIEEPPTEGEPPISRDDEAVTVLTVHSSKGLEWPVVVVLGMNHEGRGDQWSNYRIEPDRGIAMKVLDTTTGELVKTPAWNAAGEENDIREEEERKRLLYVACTRARDHLILSGVIPVDRNGREREPRGLMKYLKHGMDLSLEDFQEPCKNIGGVDVRLVSVKQGEEIISEEEDEIIPEIDVRKGETPVSCSVISGGGRRFHNPTGDEVLASMGIEREEVPGRSKMMGENGPAPDERGEIVHRAMEGVPLKRLLREYGYDDRKVERELSLMIRDLKDQVGSMDGRKFRELELVGYSKDRGNGKLPLKGRLDLLVKRDDGSFVVVDYKTGKKRKEHEAQLSAYGDMLGEGARVDTRIIYPENDS